MKKLFSFFLLVCILVSCNKEGSIDDICAQMDDPVFVYYCRKHFDTNFDGKLSKTEASAIQKISILGENAHSLRGIEYFPALTILDCYSNEIANLDVSGCHSLEELRCQVNQLTTLDVSKNIALTVLDCSHNEIRALDVSKNTALTVLDCSYTPLMSVDVSKNPGLKELTLTGCHQITSLNLNNNPALTDLALNGVGITSLDLSNNLALSFFACNSSTLTEIWLKKGQIITFFKYPQNATIKYKD